MAVKGMKPLDLTAYLLVSVGALNWGLGVLNFNLVEWILGLISLGAYSNWVYSLVGLAGAYSLYRLWK